MLVELSQIAKYPDTEKIKLGAEKQFIVPNFLAKY
jgi:hypothetical protein